MPDSPAVPGLEASPKLAGGVELQLQAKKECLTIHECLTNAVTIDRPTERPGEQVPDEEEDEDYPDMKDLVDAS